MAKINEKRKIKERNEQFLRARQKLMHKFEIEMAREEYET